MDYLKRKFYFGVFRKFNIGADTDFKTIDCDGKEFKISENYGEIENILCEIDTNYFIGTGIDKSQIVNVKYNYLPLYDQLSFIIKFDIRHYEKLLQAFQNQFDGSKAFVNADGYNEISWRANPDMSVPTCIQDIVISKRLKYDNLDTADKGICYLIINTRGRKSHGG